MDYYQNNDLITSQKSNNIFYYIYIAVVLCIVIGQFVKPSCNMEVTESSMLVCMAIKRKLLMSWLPQH